MCGFNASPKGWYTEDERQASLTTEHTLRSEAAVQFLERVRKTARHFSSFAHHRFGIPAETLVFDNAAVPFDVQVKVAESCVMTHPCGNLIQIEIPPPAAIHQRTYIDTLSTLSYMESCTLAPERIMEDLRSTIGLETVEHKMREDGIKPKAKENLIPVTCLRHCVEQIVCQHKATSKRNYED